MQKLILTFITILSLCLSLEAQTESDIKIAISTVAQSYIGWQKSGCYYFTPSDYIRDDKSNKIIGQRFINPKESEFTRFELEKINDQFLKAKMNGGQSFDLTWSKNRISKITGNGLMNYEYEITYQPNGKIKKMIGIKGVEITFNYENDQLNEIIAMGVVKGKAFPISVRKILKEDENGFKMSSKLYTRGKPMKDKNIRQSLNCSCEKINHGKYKSTYGWGETVVYTFDDSSKPIEKVINRIDGKQDTENFYYNSEGKLRRKDILKKKDNIFQEKQITILEEPENSEGLKEWETRRGLFKLNEENELVYEAINTKYREKISGSWTEWKPRRFCGVK